MELAPRRKKKFFQPEGCSRLIIELSRNKKGNCTMKSIKQLCQLSDEELKGIVRNDPDITQRIVEESLLSSAMKPAAEDFARNLSDRLCRAYQLLIESTVSEEFFSMLDEAASEGKDTSRNGYYERKIRTSLGDLTIQIPRARFLAFQTKLLKKYGHNLGDLEDRVMSLYRGGMSENDIVKSLCETEGTNISASSIQKIVHGTVGKAAEFNSERIEDCPFVYMDATYVPFKRAAGTARSVEKEGILIAVGITPSGFRRVLGYVFGETERIDLWKRLLRELKERGLNNPRMFITDGLSGMPEAIHEIFPKALHQRCLVHYTRNLCGYVRRSERKAISDDFRKVYTCKTRAEAEKEFEAFKKVWGEKYRGLRNMFDRTDGNIFSFYGFPEGIRRGLYTNNAIEGFNAELKRETRKRILMNSEDNATVVITAICRSYNSSKLGRVMNGLNELDPETRRSLGFSF